MAEDTVEDLEKKEPAEGSASEGDTPADGEETAEEAATEEAKKEEEKKEEEEEQPPEKKEPEPECKCEECPKCVQLVPAWMPTFADIIRNDSIIA